MADPVSQEKMLNLAANYEHLAKRAEDRRSGKTPQPSRRRCVHVSLYQPLANACIAACRVGSFRASAFDLVIP
jgi:hypothetical protein